MGGQRLLHGAALPDTVLVPAVRPRRCRGSVRAFGTPNEARGAKGSREGRGWVKKACGCGSAQGKKGFWAQPCRWQHALHTREKPRAVVAPRPRSLCRSIVVFPNFIDGARAQHIIELARGKLEESGLAWRPDESPDPNQVGLGCLQSAGRGKLCPALRGVPAGASQGGCGRVRP